MLNSFSTSATAHAIEIFIYALLYTGHICLFFNTAGCRTKPLSDLNYMNAVILSALITTVASYAVVFASTIRKLLLLAVIGFIATAIIPLTLQKVPKRERLILCKRALEILHIRR